ncbi:uncharacterized protein [Hoplias malabaricus]|uniref:uncharacterized protein n=1 Tax=Hoplias malabaricus TaxID=27720 RepID=UPI003462C379
MDLDQFEDSQSDSGVSADFSPNSTSENTTSVAVSSQDPSETPIEREIRLAIKREQSLRRSRGLGTAENKAEEFVEIPVRKSVLSQDLPIKSMKNEGKDRQFAGKKMQREIREETEREKVLVQLGRLPGFYDKGTVKQLKEKKLLFEAFQEVKEDCAFLQNKRPSLFFPFDLSNGGTQAEEAAGSLKKHMGSLESPAQDPNDNHNCPTVTRFSLASTGPRGPGLTESSKGEVIILENTFSPVAHSPGLERKSETVVDGSGTGRHFSVKPYSVEQLRNQEKGDNSSDNDEDSVKDNPFFKLRSSLSLRPDVEQEIREAREREKELRKQRTRLYGWGSEVEGARSSANPTSTHSNPNTVELPAKTSITITTPSVRQSLGKLDLTWPPPPPEDLRTQSELQKSPKRQRSVLLQRWENGLVNGQQE